MTDDDRRGFNALMQGLAENLGAQLSTPGIALRFEALKQFDFEDVKRATTSIAASRKYTSMPTIADFLEHLGGGSAEDVAMVQAAIVWKAMKDHGASRSVCFDDPVTQAVIVQGFGGWQKMCGETTVDKQQWFYKDFCRTYGAFARQQVTHYGALPGWCDPIRSKGPALIGNQERAQQVLLMDNRNNGPQSVCELLPNVSK